MDEERVEVSGTHKGLLIYRDACCFVPSKLLFVVFIRRSKIFEMFFASSKSYLIICGVMPNRTCLFSTSPRIRLKCFSIFGVQEASLKVQYRQVY